MYYDVETDQNSQVTLSLQKIRKIIPYIQPNQGRILYSFELVAKEIDYYNDSDRGTYNNYLNMNFESALDSNQKEESKYDVNSRHKDQVDQKIDELFKWTDDDQEMERPKSSLVQKESYAKHVQPRGTLDPSFAFRISPLSFKKSSSFPSLINTITTHDDEFGEIFDKKKSWVFGCDDYETFQTWVSLIKANIS